MTTEDLDTLKGDILKAYATIGAKMLNHHLYGVEPNCNYVQWLKELTLYQWVLNYWQQYKDGTPVPNVNYITQEEFDNIVSRVKFIIS